MFILTTERVVTDYPYTDGTVLKFRQFEGEERDEFDKQRSKLVGRKNFWEKYVLLLQQVAARLCVGWEGIVGTDGQPLACDTANKAAFFAHPEAKKYWWGPVYGYVNPQRADVKDDPASDMGEAADPDFFVGS